ncbi:DNA-binding protein [Escherichia coli]|nr:DNA-binding protein [Escherichia coli]
MRKISDLNYSHHMASADNVKPKNEFLNTWCVGMNDFARIAGRQDSRRNILSPGAFLAFLAKIFTLGYVDFSARANEAGKNMMAHVDSTSYFKNNDGSEIMQLFMSNPEGAQAASPRVIIEISLSPVSTMGTRQGHTAIIFPQPDGSTSRFEGKSFERKDESSLHLITNKALVCYQREDNKERAHLLNNDHQLNSKTPEYDEKLLKKTLASTLEKIKKEHLLLMPYAYVHDKTIQCLLGEDGILEEINNLKALLDDAKIDSGTEVNDEINNIIINLSHILIDSLDDAKVNLAPVIDSMLYTFLDLPYFNDVKILEWCLDKSMQYFNDTSKISHARAVINNIDNIDFRCDQSKIAEVLLFKLDKEPYKNSPELQKLIWDKLVVNVNDFNLSIQEKSRLIQRVINDVKQVFCNEVPVSILLNNIFKKDFFIKNREMAEWYFTQILKSYESEKSYLDNLGYDFEKSSEEVIKNQPLNVIRLFREKESNEYQLRIRMVEIIRDAKINIYPYINEQGLDKLNPPDNLRIAIEKFGWKNRTLTV